MSHVQSRPLAQERTRKGRIGFLRPGHVEGAFIALLYLALFVLVALSVIGTFYGRRGEDAPIGQPMVILATIRADPGAFGIAAAIQFVLSLVQYGTRQMSQRDRKWWLLYLVALGFSVYYNYQAYWTPLTAIIPTYFAAIVLIAGDVLPEFIAVRRE